jgi:hypothetical protein
MGDETPADLKAADASTSNTTTRFVSKNGLMAADTEGICLTASGSNVSVVDQNISIVGSSHWDDKGLQAESACNVAGSETRAVVERHSVGTHTVETLTVGDRHVVDSRVHPLGRRILTIENEIMGERIPVKNRGLAEQRPIENIMDNRQIEREHPVSKVVPFPERYTIEAVGIGERNYSDIRSVGERQFLDDKSGTEVNSADYRGVAERYHVDSRVLRERHPVDSRSLIAEPRTLRDSYCVDARVMRDRHLVDSRFGDDGPRTAVEGCSVDSRFPADSRATGKLQHMGRDWYNAEVASAREIFPIDPTYPVGIGHSIDVMALNQGRPVETRNMGERYPLESRVLVEGYTVDPRANGNGYTVEAAIMGKRVVWTEEANNVR